MQTPGYQQTDAGLIPTDWSALQVRDVCRLINGRGFKPYEWSDRGLPIIRIQNLNGSGEFNYFQGRFDPKILVKNGELLFAWSGSRGTSFGPFLWRGQDAVLNYHTWKVVPNSTVTKDFLYYALKGLTSFIEGNAHGASALVHTQKWEMEGFYLAVPAISMQRRIVEALRSIDDFVSRLEKLIVKKQAIKQGMVQQLLTGRIRLPGFTQPWISGPLKRFMPLQRGFDLPASQVRPGPYPVVYSNGIARTHSVAMAKGPGVITGRSGTIGKVHYVDCDYWPHNTSLWVTSFVHADAKFAYYYLSHLGLERFASGSGVPTFNRNDAHGFEIHLPSERVEQASIARVLSDCDDELSSLHRRLAKARSTKQGMMQELLTGRTRLPVKQAAP